ncbi:MAG: T9SS type A sorting domain-containing protein [Bacteroidetes bacterium]|nr:T9SS type A sorting domain-containing protein [Bacteroidota bacterium]
MKKAIIFCLCLFAAHFSYAQYCVPVTSVPCSQSTTYKMYITNITTTGGTTNINNANNTCSGYNYYTGTGNTLYVNAGTTFTLNITVINPGGSPGFKFSGGVWIDWDGDNVFNTGGACNGYYNATTNPTGELMGTNLVCPTATAWTVNTQTYTIPVPTSAKDGLVRMRIRVGTGTNSGFPPISIDPCASAGVTYGEVEDYDVVVSNPCIPSTSVVFSNITYKSLDIQWSKKGNEKYFEYLIDQNPVNPGGGNYLTKKQSMNLPDTIYKHLDCNTKYYLHLRSICDTTGPQASWATSNWRLDSFTTSPCCYTPDVNISNITSNSAVATWNPVQSVLQYEYAIRIDTITPLKGTITTNTSALLPGLGSAREYYFFIRAYCTPTPNSDWGLDSFLTQPSTYVDPLAMKSFAILAMPNPVKDIVSLHVVKGLRNGEGIITVMDMTGKTVLTQKVDKDVTDVNLSGNPSGVYFIRYKDDEYTDMVKVTKE